uniref:NADH-ubiquinone oxidoreductase chain 4 n=1 Tax=Sigalphus bicolor TaxID=515846 RepID=A0A0A6ZLA3_9HYME|nr:NADH dehydrogenase subunit 4 [Sigalphus bicolor]
MMKLIMFMILTMFFMNFKNMKMFMFINMFLINILMMKLFNSMNLIFTNIYMSLMIDYISFVMIMLSIWIINLSIIANNYLLNMIFCKMYKFILLILLLFLFFSFCSINMFMFYLMFEASLIPLLILNYSMSETNYRIQAGMYMLMYTLLGSLPFLMLMFYQFSIYNTLMFNILMLMKLKQFNLMFYFMFMMVFLIKLPMYFIHLWLPKAHVEAPISGSMILASIMLKLGIYGIIRMTEFYLKMMLSFNYLLINLLILGSIFSSLICLNQTDMKIIIAYSSIVHMNFLLGSMLMMSMWTLKGAVILMIAHGLCSPSMFCLANFFYERSNSRLLLMNKGLNYLFPIMTMWMFLIFSNNFSSPPSLNLMGEMFMSFKFINYSNIYLIMLFLMMFFSTMYSIFLYSLSQYNQSIYYMYMNNMNIREYLINLFHWIPLNFLFLNLFFFI